VSEFDPAQRLRYRAELARTEKMSAAELAQYSRQQLLRLAEFAWRNVPYYRKRLAPLFSGRPGNERAWLEVPILTRALAAAKYAELQASALPAYAGKVETSITSGSTGAPLRYRSSAIEAAVSIALTERSFDWWRLDGNRTLGALHYFPPSWPFAIGKPMRGWREGSPDGLSHSLQIAEPVDAQLQWLQRHRIDYLKTRPSAAEVLAEENLRRGLGIRLAAILTVGGPVSQRCREICRQSFGAEIYDTYGLRECGHLATECPDCRLMHIDAEARLIEVVKDDLSPCAPGETGRVLVTSYYSYAMPFIRYDLGDYAELGPAQAPCGRPYPSLARIMGRESESFLRRDGSRYFPLIQARNLLDVMAFKQVQFVQTDYETLEIRYVAADGAPPIDSAAVERYARHAMGENFAIHLVPLPAIPHTPGAKYFYHRCEVQPPAQVSR
jgi:phenylacetate-CoA ligase